MEQQRRIGLAHQIATAPSSSTSTSLLGIGEELYELLQGGTATSSTTRAKTCGSVVNPNLFFDQVPKMEPELGDFMGCSYTWGAPAATPLQQQQQQQQQQHYNVATTESLACYSQLPDHQQFAYGSANAAVASPQIQALRDFMVYGSGSVQPAVPALPTMTSFSSAVSSRAVTPVGVGFYQGLEDVGVVDAAGLQVAGGAPKAQDMSLAYRALCSEIYATERSPHRSQFQRENHILAERQRREEMNEKFSALRAMIPKATKKDKASIVGDTIDYVLELEKRLKQLQACKDTASGVTPGSGTTSGTGFFKSLKRKSPHGERREDAGSAPAALDSPKPSSSETTLQRDPRSPSPLRDGRDSTVSSPISDPITADSKLNAAKPMKVVEAGVAEVDVQQLGQQAVVKVVCSPQRGHVLRVLNALEECKVEVLQSNVMTVADNSIHFITIQLEEEVSASSEELVSAVLQAINQDQH